MNRIAVVASYIHPNRQKHLLDWYIDFSKTKDSIKLFIGSKTKEIPFAYNYKINSSKQRLFYSVLNVFSLKRVPKHLKKIQPLINYHPDIIHLLTSNAFKNTEPYLKNNTCKLIVSFRGFDINVFPHQSEENLTITMKVFSRADILHFISNALRKKAISLGANPEKCIVINRSIKVQTETLLSKESNNSTKIKILSVGRLVWEKGYLYALETMALLKEKGYDFEYHIVGSGIDKNMLQYHRKRLDLTDNVYFVGELSKEGVKEVLCTADIYFQPSVSEALSLAIIEASYFRLPIVSSSVGGIPEVVVHGKTGYLSSPCVPLLYSKNIIKLIEDKELRVKMGNAGHNRIVNFFSRDNEISLWNNLYANLDI